MYLISRNVYVFKNPKKVLNNSTLLYSAHAAFFHDLDSFKLTVFQNFSGCSHPIFKCLISLDLSFYQLSNAIFKIVLQQKLAKRREKGKLKTMARLFFRIWIPSNIFHDFSGCSRPIFKCFDTIRFVFLLAFQCRKRDRKMKTFVILPETISKCVFDFIF